MKSFISTILKKVELVNQLWLAIDTSMEEDESSGSQGKKTFNVKNVSDDLQPIKT